jgi:hypothetical protein
MNKIILAYYINIGNLDAADVQQLVSAFKKEVSDSGMIQYFIPIRDGETRIDCVYPKYVVGEKVDEEFKDVIGRMDNYIKNLELVKMLNPEKNKSDE